MTVPTHGDDESARVCLIHAGAIGDFILALRVVGSLRSHFPTAAVDVLGHQAIASLAVGRGGVDSVTSLERLRVHTMFSEDGPVDSSCVAYFASFGMIVNMYATAEQTFTRRLHEISSARVVTIDTAPRSRTRHVTEDWLDDLRAGGITPSPSPPTLRFGDDERRQGRQRLCGLTGDGDGPIVLVHPGSGGRTKCWPLERFVGLAEALRTTGARCVFMLGPVELERHGETIESRLSAIAPVLVEGDLVRVATIIAAADAYVGNDAGMTHLAAATGTPTVAIFGPTDPAVWRPLGEHVTVVRGDRLDTFDGVTVERVAEAADASLRT